MNWFAEADADDLPEHFETLSPSHQDQVLDFRERLLIILDDAREVIKHGSLGQHKAKLDSEYFKLRVLRLLDVLNMHVNMLRGRAALDQDLEERETPQVVDMESPIKPARRAGYVRLSGHEATAYWVQWQVETYAQFAETAKQVVQVGTEQLLPEIKLERIVDDLIHLNTLPLSELKLHHVPNSSLETAFNAVKQLSHDNGFLKKEIADHMAELKKELIKEDINHASDVVGVTRQIKKAADEAYRDVVGDESHQGKYTKMLEHSRRILDAWNLPREIEFAAKALLRDYRLDGDDLRTLSLGAIHSNMLVYRFKERVHNTAIVVVVGELHPHHQFHGEDAVKKYEHYELSALRSLVFQIDQAVATSRRSALHKYQTNLRTAEAELVQYCYQHGWVMDEFVHAAVRLLETIPPLEEATKRQLWQATRHLPTQKEAIVSFLHLLKSHAAHLQGQHVMLEHIGAPKHPHVSPGVLGRSDDVFKKQFQSILQRLWDVFPLLSTWHGLTAEQVREYRVKLNSAHKYCLTVYEKEEAFGLQAHGREEVRRKLLIKLGSNVDHVRESIERSEEAVRRARAAYKTHHEQFCSAVQTALGTVPHASELVKAAHCLPSRQSVDDINDVQVIAEKCQSAHVMYTSVLRLIELAVHPNNNSDKLQHHVSGRHGVMKLEEVRAKQRAGPESAEFASAFDELFKCCVLIDVFDDVLCKLLGLSEVDRQKQFRLIGALLEAAAKLDAPSTDWTRIEDEAKTHIAGFARMLGSDPKVESQQRSQHTRGLRDYVTTLDLDESLYGDAEALLDMVPTTTSRLQAVQDMISAELGHIPIVSLTDVLRVLKVSLKDLEKEHDAVLPPLAHEDKLRNALAVLERCRHLQTMIVPSELPNAPLGFVYEVCKVLALCSPIHGLTDAESKQVREGVVEKLKEIFINWFADQEHAAQEARNCIQSASRTVSQPVELMQRLLLASFSAKVKQSIRGSIEHFQTLLIASEGCWIWIALGFTPLDKALLKCRLTSLALKLDQQKSSSALSEFETLVRQLDSEWRRATQHAEESAARLHKMNEFRATLVGYHLPDAVFAEVAALHHYPAELSDALGPGLIEIYDCKYGAALAMASLSFLLDRPQLTDLAHDSASPFFGTFDQHFRELHKARELALPLPIRVHGLENYALALEMAMSIMADCSGLHGFDERMRARLSEAVEDALDELAHGVPENQVVSKLKEAREIANAVRNLEETRCEAADVSGSNFDSNELLAEQYRHCMAVARVLLESWFISLDLRLVLLDFLMTASPDLYNGDVERHPWFEVKMSLVLFCEKARAVFRLLSLIHEPPLMYSEPQHAVGVSAAVKAALAIACCAAASQHAQGTTYKGQRNLRSKTIVLVGGFSNTGLALLQQLARDGAQVIALHPDPADARILQLVTLIRHSADNERIYAEQCDMTDCASIKAFADRWTKDGRSGMVQDLEARIDAVVFCDGDGSGLESANADGHRTAYVTARHALVQSLLPVLLRSSQSSTSPIRVVGQVSPLYALNVPSARQTLDARPWLSEAQTTLSSIALYRESQCRLAPKGLCFVNACSGFTRQWLYNFIRQLGTYYVSSWFGVLLTWLMWPLVWMFGKSSHSAAQVLLMALCAPVVQSHVPQTEDLVERNGKFQSDGGGQHDDSGQLNIVGGGVYRDGQLIRVTALERLSPHFGRHIWDEETDTIKQRLAPHEKNA
ncbi:hypothetical protein ACM66B_002243 [Microbotryomycetes sp. NB124-2]